MPDTVANPSTARRRELARAAFDAGPDAVLLVDSTGVIVLTNHRADTMFGFPAGGLVGRQLAELVPGDLRAHHDAYVFRYFTAPRIRPMGTGLEIRARRSDGSEFPAEVSLSPVDRADGRSIVAASVRDITHRARVHEERAEALRQREREAEARIAEAAQQVTKARYDSVEYHRALRHYTQVVRHRVANPLNVILGMTETLRAMPDIDERTRGEMLDAIHDAARRLAQDTIFAAEVQGPEEHELRPSPHGAVPPAAPSGSGGRP